MRHWLWQALGRILRALGMLTPYECLGQQWFEGRTMNGTLLGHMESFGDLRIFGTVTTWIFKRPMTETELAHEWPDKRRNSDGTAA